MNNISPSKKSQLSPLKRAFLAINDLQTRLKITEQRQSEPIAIVGVGCRFPGANDPDAFWQMLRDGVDAISEIPPDRWDVDAFYDPEPGAPNKTYIREGGFVDDVGLFDPHFFGISPREAVRTDPQQRILLQVVWQALERACIIPEQLAGTKTGVFLGISNNDYSLVQHRHDESPDAYHGTGNAFCIAANRISYLLDLRGPSVAMDTACSSSLVAVHLAVQSLRNQETNVALAGGVNLMLSPETTLVFSHARMMAMTGRCRTFDAGADGYIRGEGVGVVVLKRLSDAQKAGDNILALIHGSAINQDGRSNGITAPNGLAQQAVIREALKNAKLTPEQISYIETHGTGTILGDPIEVQALGVIMKDRPKTQPCLIGSVKTNIGHLESAAGIAGLIKLVLALQHNEIPPHLHFNTINPHIPIDELPLEIPTTRRAWPENVKHRYAGLSSFGFGGTNAHIVVGEAPVQPPAENAVERTQHILALSTKDEISLKALAQQFADYSPDAGEIALTDICYSANTGRSQLPVRLAVQASDFAEMKERLAEYAAGEFPVGLHDGEMELNKRFKSAFLFTGQGAQYAGMGRALYETQPAFRKTLDQCNEILKAWLEKPLLSVIFPEEDKPALLDETAYTQPALFAIEYALAKLWLAWGIKPNYVMGHSVGEYVAACVAGVFSLEDGLKLIAARGRLMQSLPHDGTMAVIFAKEEQVAEALRDYSAEISIAGVNGPNNIVISGKTECVEQIAKQFENEGVETRSLTVSHAFHSPLMDPILAEFEKIAQEVEYKAPQIPIVSNLTGEVLDSKTIPGANYWRKHIRQAVQFNAGMKILAEKGCELFIEPGPHPVMLGMGRRCIPGAPAVWLPSLKKGQDDWQMLLDSLAKLHIHGAEIDWPGFDQDYSRNKVELPTYPFQRERYWVDESRQQLPPAPDKPGLSGEPGHPLLGRKLLSPLNLNQWETQLNRESHSYFTDYSLSNVAVLPVLAQLEMVVAANQQMIKDGVYLLRDVVFADFLTFSPEPKDNTIQLILKPENSATTSFQIFRLNRQDENKTAEWTLLGDGQISPQAEDAPPKMENGLLEEIQRRCTQNEAVAHFYGVLAAQQIQYGSSFQILEKLWKNDRESLGLLQLPDEILANSDYQVHPVLLEACAQILMATLTDEEIQQTPAVPLIPTSVHQVAFYHQPKATLWSHAVRRSDVNLAEGEIAGDIRIFDAHGQVIIELLGLSLQPIDNEKLVKLQQQAAEQTVDEQEVEAAASSVKLTKEQVLQAAPEERVRLLENEMRESIAKVLNLPAKRINVKQPITNLGLDSIMAIEMRNNIETSLKINYPIANLLEGPNLTQIAEQLLDILTSETDDDSIKLVAAETSALEYPLSHGQRAMWFQHRMAPDSIFNLLYAVRIPAEIDVAALKSVFQKLVERHPTLRSTFSAQKGEPVQQIQENMEVAFNRVDAAGWTAEELKARLEEEAHRPFDLENGPLFRVHLFSRSANDHVLLQTIHHIVADLWSQAIIASEIGQLYSAVKSGSDLPEINVQYSDFIRWQGEMLDSPQGAELWKYWQEKLAGELPVLNLSTDRPRPAVQTFKGSLKALKFKNELAHKLKLISEENGATLFMTLLTAFKVLLYRYTGQDDLVVGTPTTGRSHHDLSPMVGYFVNPLPLRSDLSGEPRFVDFLAQVRQTVVDVIAHQDYPLALLVEKLQPPRDTSRTPFFQVMFVLQRAHLLNDAGLSSFAIGSEENELNLGGLPLRSMPLEERGAPFELTLMMAESSEGLAASLTYNTALFDEATIDRMLSHYEKLLISIAENPAEKISQLSLLPKVEQDILIHEFNANERDFELEKCAHEIIEQTAAKYPEHAAVVFEEKNVTYAELNRRANQLARYLRKQGVQPDVLVGVCLERSVEMIVSILGVMKAGGAYLPMDPDYPPERLTLMLEDSAVPVLITQNSLLDKISAGEAHLVQIDRDWPTIAAEKDTNRHSGATPENLAYAIYTSGSTGKPKGTLLRHRGLCNFATAHVETLGTDQNDRWLQFASFSFDASVSEIFTALFAGATLYLARRETLLAGNKLIALLKEQAISYAILPPSLLSVLPADNLPKLKNIISAGEACTREIVTKWADNRNFYNGYGPTEATVGPTLNKIEAFDENQTNISIGKPLANVKIYILDQNMQPAPIGMPGELHIGGSCLARGYHNRSELTAEKFIPDPFCPVEGARLYKTGDLARYLIDGNLEFLGRIDHQVKIRGFRIETEEIEAVLGRHEAITEVVVLAKKDKSGQDRLVAYWVANGKAVPETGELRAYLLEKLPEYMVPTAFMPLEAFPLTPNGKVNRRALPAPEDFQLSSSANFVKPRTEIEQQLASIWQEVLTVEKVGIYDNFFDLGGHSLAMMKVHGQLGELLEKDINIVEMFRYPTINSLTKFLTEEQNKTPVYLEKQKRASQQREALNLQRQRMRNRRKK